MLTEPNTRVESYWCSAGATHWVLGHWVEPNANAVEFEKLAVFGSQAPSQEQG